MSHFAVAVILEDKNKLEKVLAPYDENLIVDRYVKYTKEELIKKEKESIESYKNSTYAEYLENPAEYKKNCKNEGHIKYLEEEFPKKLNWTDEEIYNHEIQFYEKDEIGENGEIYSTYNPNSKWDWYAIGGRYNNLIVVDKDNNDVVDHYDFGLGMSLKSYVDGEPNLKKVNGARIKDIHFDKMGGDYEKAIRFWELIVEGQEPKDEQEKERIKWNFYKPEYYIERYKTKEEYAKQESMFVTWALVDEKGWLEQGKMGWWGLNDATNESTKSFAEVFQEYINEPNNQDKYMVIVDCHI